MSKTLIYNLSFGPVEPRPYGSRALLPGRANGVIVADASATVIANLGGAAAIAGLWGVEDVPDASPTDTVRVGPVTNGQSGVGFPVEYFFDIADAATADYNITIAEKVEITDVVVQKRSTAAGANANSVQVKNGSTAISDVISINAAADTALVRATKIDDAAATIAAGGTLRVSVIKAGGDAAVFVKVTGVRRP